MISSPWSSKHLQKPSAEHCCRLCIRLIGNSELVPTLLMLTQLATQMINSSHLNSNLTRPAISNKPGKCTAMGCWATFMVPGNQQSILGRMRYKLHVNDLLDFFSILSKQHQSTPTWKGRWILVDDCDPYSSQQPLLLLTKLMKTPIICCNNCCGLKFCEVPVKAAGQNLLCLFRKEWGLGRELCRCGKEDISKTLGVMLLLSMRIACGILVLVQEATLPHS